MLAVALSLTLGVAGCSSKQGPGIVGKWAQGNDLVFTFTKDGDMIREEGASSETMGYSVKGTTLYLKPKDQPMSLVYTVSFPTDREIVLTPQTTQPGQDATPIQLTRVAE